VVQIVGLTGLERKRIQADKDRGPNLPGESRGGKKSEELSPYRIPENVRDPLGGGQKNSDPVEKNPHLKLPDGNGGGREAEKRRSSASNLLV